MVKYIQNKNEEGAFIGGVPLRDLTEAEWKGLTDQQRKDVEAAPFYSVRTDKQARDTKENN